MKIAVAQLEAIKGNIDANISKHLELIQSVKSEQPSAIFFPELSVTGYEPELAKQLATDKNDSRFDAFQELSDEMSCVIGLGLPITSASKPHIGMLVFQPNCPVVTYSKQFLHPGEEKYFSPGDRQLFLDIKEYKIAPAICYESSVENHQKYAMDNGANMYIASVLNSKDGISKEMNNLSNVASKYNVTVMMSNYVGFSGGYDAAGKSAVWNDRGDVIDFLGEKDEGLLIYNTRSKNTLKVLLRK